MRKFAGIFAGIFVALAAMGLSSDGVSAAANDLVVTGPGVGGGADIRTFSPTGQDGGVTFTSNGTPTSGASVAAGDITGDGTPEIITGTGPGVIAQVQVWAKDGKTLVAQANPFPGFTGGISVAAANVNETPELEVIVAAGPGGGPHVKALRLVTGQLNEVYSFYAYEPGFSGGVYVAGTGGRIITGPGAGGGPHVKVFRIFLGEITVDDQWMAYGAFTGGVRVAAGAVRSPSTVDVVTGAGPGGGPHVKLWTLDGVEGPGLMAYGDAFRGGVWVAVGNGQHLITGAGAGGGPHVIARTFGPNTTFPIKASFMAYPVTFAGGVHVGGFPLTTGAPTTTTTECVGIPPLCLPNDTTTTAAPTTTIATTTTTAAPTTTTSTTSTTLLPV